jgi:hypothetical protein
MSIISMFIQQKPCVQTVNNDSKNVIYIELQFQDSQSKSMTGE